MTNDEFWTSVEERVRALGAIDTGAHPDLGPLVAEVKRLRESLYRVYSACGFYEDGFDTSAWPYNALAFSRREAMRALAGEEG